MHPFPPKRLDNSIRVSHSGPAETSPESGTGPRFVLLLTISGTPNAAQRGGRIVNILSTAAAQGFALASSYCASKGAALLITRALAIELAQYDILVNGVGPGTIEAPTSDSYLAESEISDLELSRIPLARFGQPSDIAEAVAFLATRATWLTGQAIYVDGGFMAAGLPYLKSLPAPD